MAAPGRTTAAVAAALALLLATTPAALAHGGQYRPPPEDPPPPPPPDPPPPPPVREKTPTPRDQPADPPEKAPGTPTPPGNPGGGIPQPPDTGGGTPTPPATPGPGGTPTPRDPTPDPRTRKKGPRGRGESLEEWSAWWYYARDRWLVRPAAPVATPVEGLGAAGDVGRAPAAAEREAWRDRALAALRRSFPHGDVEIFTGSAVALGKAGDGADAPALLRALEGRYADASVRESVVLGLGLLGPGVPAGREALSAILADRKDSARLRGMAALALGLRRDPAAAPLLLSVAREPSPTGDPAASALVALGLLGESLVVPDLVEFLDDESTTDAKALRPFAAAALGRLGGAEAVRALGRALADAEPQVRRAAVLALAECAPADAALLVPALVRGAREDRDRPSRHFALIALGRLGGGAAGDALGRAYALGDRGERNFAALGLALHGRGHPDPEVRARIAAMLRGDFLERDDADLKGALAIGLGLLGDEAAAAPLRAVLRDRGDPELRAHAALALGLLRAAEAAPDLHRCLEEKGHPALVREAALALGLLGDGGASKVLVGLLGSSSPEHVRASAARALGNLGGAAAAAALADLVVDASAAEAVRGQAAVGLGLLLDPRHPGGLATLSAGLNFFATTPALREALTIP